MVSTHVKSEHLNVCESFCVNIWALRDGLLLLGGNAIHIDNWLSRLIISNYHISRNTCADVLLGCFFFLQRSLAAKYTASFTKYVKNQPLLSSSHICTHYHGSCTELQVVKSRGHALLIGQFSGVFRGPVPGSVVSYGNFFFFFLY